MFIPSHMVRMGSTNPNIAIRLLGRSGVAPIPGAKSARWHALAEECRLKNRQAVGEYWQVKELIPTCIRNGFIDAFQNQLIHYDRKNAILEAVELLFT